MKERPTIPDLCPLFILLLKAQYAFDKYVDSTEGSPGKPIYKERLIALQLEILDFKYQGCPLCCVCSYSRSTN